MRINSRYLATTSATLAVIASGFGVPVATAESPSAEASGLADLGPATTESHLVTLLSGDVIRVDELADGTQRGVVARDVGPQGISISSVDAKVTAIPYEAVPLVVDGSLDLGLFDVSRLVKDGYADDDTSTVPVIVTYAGERLRSAAIPEGARATARFHHLNAAAAEVDKGKATEFWAGLVDGTSSPTTPSPTLSKEAALPRGIDRIWLDRKVSVALDESVPYIGAPQAWSDGYDGAGVTVAVLDTGVDTSHPDLAGAVIQNENFTFHPDAVDHNGHGTHVASTIAGNGSASDGMRNGVAPGVQLLNGKVLADWGTGQTSWIMAGMEWAVAEDADIVSMSLGACCGDGTDILSQLVNELSAQSDTLFVIAAGNDGPSRGTIGAPGTASSALTVGATGHTDDTVASFSSRGPDRGFHLKPDITAPGVGIVAARAAGTAAGTPVDDNYTALNGTSMATPHVAGAAAILRQQHPDWSAQQVKDALVSTGSLGPDDVYAQGGGRVDVEHAVRQQVHATGSVDFGPHEAPFSDGQTATEEITYANHSDSAVSLDLAVEATRIDDPAAEPTAAITVSPTHLTVPAGGTASATVTVDLTAGELATYGGWVTATDAEQGIEAHTSVGWTKRPEHAQLTVTVQDRLGGPAPFGLVWLFNLEAGTTHVGNIANGQVRYADLGLNPEVPVGHYMLLASFPTRVEDSRPVHFVEAVLPEMDLTEDTEFVVDAAQAEQLRFETPRPTQELGMYRITAERTVNGHVIRAGSPLGDISLVTNQAPYVTPTEPVTEGDFAVTMYGRVVGPPVTAAPTTGPDRRTLEPYYLWCIANEACFPEFDGEKVLDIVDAGNGSQQMLTAERVGGKVAVVNPDPVDSTEDLARRAEAAGAAGVVFWEDDGPVASTVRSISVRIPLMWVAASDGAWLADRAGRFASFRFSGERPIPYAYDVAVTEEGQVPDDLTYTADVSQQATVHREVRHRGPVPVCTHWDDLPAWLSGFCRPTPHQWTHYALPGLQYVSLTGSSWGADIYQPGETLDEVFDAGPLAPGAVESELFPVPSSTRANGADADTVTFTPGEPLREADPTRFNRRFWPLIDEQITVYRGDEKIAEEAARELTVTVPAEAAEYRFVYDASTFLPDSPRTTRSHTEWTFDSEHGAEETAVLPQLQVKYDVPLDVYNRAKAGRRVPVWIRIDQPVRSTSSASVSDATLAVSFDGGATWRDVELRRRGDRWFGLVQHPRFDQTDGYVAMRVRGTDTDGNTVDQTLYQAYALFP